MRGESVGRKYNFRPDCVKRLDNTASIACGAFLVRTKFFLPAAAFATPAAANQVLVVANILTVYTNYCVFFKILAQRSILTYCSPSISAKPRTCIPLSRNGASINLSAQAARSNMICSPAEVLINTGL